MAGTPVTFAARERIAAFALSNRLPTACAFSVWSMRAACFPTALRAEVRVDCTPAEYVDRIFRGARPDDCRSINRPTYELVINPKTAKALGLPIPQSVLLRADRVIE